MSLITIENYNKIIDYLNAGTATPDFYLHDFVQQLLDERMLTHKDLGKVTTVQFILDSEEFIIKKEIKKCLE